MTETVRSTRTIFSVEMDILISSEIWSVYCSWFPDIMMLWLQDLMKQLNETGKHSVPAAVFETIGNQFEGGPCDDVQTKQTIAQLFDEKKYLADTHTAVAVKVYEDYRERTGDTTPTVIASTASPFKFCQSVISALGGTVSSDGTELLDQLHDMTGAPIPAPLAALSGLKPRFDLVIDRENILNTVEYCWDRFNPWRCIRLQTCICPPMSKSQWTSSAANGRDTWKRFRKTGGQSFSRRIRS